MANPRNADILTRSGRQRPTLGDAPVSILGIIFLPLIFRAIFPDSTHST